MEKMPSPVMTPTPCPQCGARNEDEANDKCTQAQDITGEYTCAGEFDEDGVSVQPTPESLAAMDAWIDKHADDPVGAMAMSSAEHDGL